VTKEALYSLLDAALEGANITQADYNAVRRDMRINALDEKQLQQVIGWLEACQKFPDAMLAYPDFVIEEIREQNELDMRPEYNNTKKGLPMFEKKGVWHSEFVKAGSVKIQITSDVLKSKFGKEDFVCFKTEDGGEHTYAIENDGIRATLENLPKNTWLTVHASGSRDTAAISVDEAPTQSQITRTAPKPTPNIQPATPLADQMLECLEAAHDAVEKYAANHDGAEPSEAVRAIASGFFIERQRAPQKALVA
jgi:hypothetical protein